MLASNDWSVIFDCVHQNGKHLLCEHDACDGCLLRDLKGTHRLSKAIKAFHEWEDYVNYECAIEIW